MPTLKQIQQRIKTSKNVQQITRAMKLVSAARLTRAKNSVEMARPYAEKMREFVSKIGGAGQLPAHPLLERREVERSCLILITSDRGLAGAYNASLLRQANEFLHEQKSDTSLYCIGRKGAQFFKKRGFDVEHPTSIPTSGANLLLAQDVTNEVTRRFVEGEVDAVYLCYSKFISPIRQIPQVVQVLPIEPPKDEDEAGAKDRAKEYLFEPDPKGLLELLLPKYLLTVIFQALLEATASEHGARMSAMSSATDKATEMIQTLTLNANRARQSSITKELLEIVAGAEALKS